MFGRISPNRMRMRDSPIACVARTKSRSTISSDEPRTTRAVRGIVVRPIVITSSERLGPTVAAATSVRTICGKQRMTSIVRIRRSSTRPRAYAATSPTMMPSPTPSAGRERRQREHRAAAPEEAREHVARRGRPCRTSSAGSGRRARRSGRSGRPERTTGRSSAISSSAMNSDEADLHAAHAQRAQHHLHDRPVAAAARDDRDAGDLDLGGAHLSDVRTRGLTSRVTTSAIRFTTT